MERGPSLSLSISDEAPPIADIDSCLPLADSVGGAIAVRGWFEPPRGVILVEGVASFHFSCDEEVVIAYPRAGGSSETVAHSFYSTAVALMAWARTGVEAIHASGVRGPRGVLAFCGPSGSGKTTLAQALAARGFEQVAEDALGFSALRREVRVVPLPFSVNLRKASREHFETTGMRYRSTTVVELEETDLPLAAVGILESPADRSRAVDIEPLSPAVALLRLLENAHRFRRQPAERERRMFEAYFALVESVPVYRLAYPHDFAHLNQILESIETALGA
jgi:AAA domain